MIEMTEQEYIEERESGNSVQFNARRKLTFEEYVEIGKECKEIEAAMHKISDILSSGHLNLKSMKGITGKGTRSFSSEVFVIQKQMIMMKGAFDDNLARDYPDEFDTKVFYKN